MDLSIYVDLTMQLSWNIDIDQTERKNNKKISSRSFRLLTVHINTHIQITLMINHSK